MASFGTWYRAFLSVLSASTNLVMLGSPWAVLRRTRAALRVLGWACAACFLINAQWWAFDMGGALLRIGYWLWSCAFLAIAIGALRLGRRVPQ
jgi:hypothetical protein